MKSRERVLTTLAHQEPDRVPVDLGGMWTTTIATPAYKRLCRLLGVDGLPRMAPYENTVLEVDPAVLRLIGGDTLAVRAEPSSWKEWTLPDGTTGLVSSDWQPEVLPDGSQEFTDSLGFRCLFPQGGFYFDRLGPPPLGRVETVAEMEDRIEKSAWAQPLQETQLEGLRRKAERLYHETEYLLIGNLYVGMYEFAWTLRGFEQFHLDLALNPKMAECLLAGLVAVQCRRLGQYLDAVGDYVPVIPISDDLGQQEGPLISPETYRKFIKPYQRQICEFIKERHRYLLLHCCGAVSEFIPDFIEMGVDALNPIQVSAKGMDTRKLKQEFGRDITLWGGGCDTQRVLPFGTPALVRDEVKKRLEDLASGGGFVFCQVHNIQANVPPENILAMYQAVREYGEYAQVRKEVSA